MGRKKSFGGFSMKRAIGVSKVKTKISRATGIPTTKAGRKRKAQAVVTKAATGGCLTLILEALAIVGTVAALLAMAF